MKALGDLVLMGLGQIKNLRAEVLSSDPVSPFSGQVWFNTTDGVFKGYDGTTTISFATGGNTTSITSEINAIETGAGLNSDGTFTAPTGTNYLGSITTLKDGLVALDTQVKTNADAITTLQDRATTDEGLITGLQTEIDAVETGVGLNTDGTYTAPVGTNYISAEATIKAALVALDTQIKTNTDTGPLKVTKAGDSMTGNLVMSSGATVTGLPSPTNGADAVDWATVQSIVGGLSWRPEVAALDSSSTTLPATTATLIDGHTVVNGDRVLFTALSANNNQVYSAAVAGADITWTAVNDLQRPSPVPNNGDALLVLSGTVYGLSAFTFNGTTWVQYNGGTQIIDGVGLTKTGNRLDVNLGAGISELPTKEVGVDVYANGGLFLTVDGSAASTNTAAQLSILLDGGSLSLSATGLKVTDAGITSSQLAASVAGGGLTGGAGNALAVGAGTGITVNADDVALDLTYADGRYINTAGDTMTGALVLAGDATAALHPITKQVFDALEARVNGATFVYDGSTAATTHTVTHNLGFQYCNVTVVDSSNGVIIPDSITFDSTTQLTVVLNSSSTCKVVVTGVKA